MTNIAKEIIFDSSIPIFDATDFLSQRHREILDLFDDYNSARIVAEKQLIAKELCKLLTINLHLEDEIFYPEAKRALKEKGWVSAITMEHSIVKYLISEIESLDVDSAIYDIKIRVLGEQVRYLIKEKQTKLFPKVNASNKIDLWRLGSQLAARQHFLVHAFAGK
ncbi:MAG: hemerythrin domain-containing protein [Sphingobacteriales bacterium]|nr:MAG: hemerythrin domain-containing protein [Sphingobacteriales bacterium]